MPVVVKEAMAMELPVVASNEVGLPELVRPEWGRLTPPGDPSSLASGIEEILALDNATLHAMGAAARAHVVERCSTLVETRRLSHLFVELG
jgi:glycosyltransferase involved in cell wall biosynthesis